MMIVKHARDLAELACGFLARQIPQPKIDQELHGIPVSTVRRRAAVLREELPVLYLDEAPGTSIEIKSICVAEILLGLGMRPIRAVWHDMTIATGVSRSYLGVHASLGVGQVDGVHRVVGLAFLDDQIRKTVAGIPRARTRIVG